MIKTKKMPNTWSIFGQTLGKGQALSLSAYKTVGARRFELPTP